MSWPSYSAFVRDRLALGPTLCCPMRVLWKGYLAYCREWSFEPASAEQFTLWLLGEEGVAVMKGGRGRLRRYATGVGFAAERKTGT